MSAAHTTNYAQSSLTHAHNAMNLKHYINRLCYGKYNLLYLNINSLLNKLDDLESTIATISNINAKKTIHFIALTEIRLYEHNIPYFNIPNYIPYFCTRHDGYGGCALFVHASLNSNLIDKQSLHNIELLSVKVVDLSLHVTVVYKQPTVNNEVFLDTFEKFIANKRNMLIIGDMNIDLLTDTNAMHRYIDLLSSHGHVILNKINKNFATRIALKRSKRTMTITESRTVIDHAISDCLNFSFKYSQIATHLSDHMQLLVGFDDHNSNRFIATQKFITYNKLDINAYNHDIRIFLNNSVINSFDDLVNGFTICKNEHMHTITNSIKCNQTKPWLNNDFFNLLNERKRYFALKKKSPTNEYLKQKYDDICDVIRRRNSLQRISTIPRECGVT